MTSPAKPGYPARICCQEPLTPVGYRVFGDVVTTLVRIEPGEAHHPGYRFAFDPGKVPLQVGWLIVNYGNVYEVQAIAELDGTWTATVSRRANSARG